MPACIACCFQSSGFPCRTDIHHTVYFCCLAVHLDSLHSAWSPQEHVCRLSTASSLLMLSIPGTFSIQTTAGIFLPRSHPGHVHRLLPLLKICPNMPAFQPKGYHCGILPCHHDPQCMTPMAFSMPTASPCLPFCLA